MSSRNLIFRLPHVVALGLALASAFQACGNGKAGAETQGEGEGDGVPKVRLGSEPRRLGDALVPADAHLVSFDDAGHLRVRNRKGSSFLVSAGAGTKAANGTEGGAGGSAVVEWALTTAEATALGGSEGVFRAADGLAWRFSKDKVNAYTRSGAGARWRTYEADVKGTWTPLAVESMGVVAFVGGTVLTAWMSEGKLKAKEFGWPKGLRAPDSAGFLQGRDVVWVHGAGNFYSVNVVTGVWKAEVFEVDSAPWGKVKSMAFRTGIKDPFSLSNPRSFAVLAEKGLFALPFVDPPR